MPADPLAERVRAYADLLARHPAGLIPVADVLWKLRHMLADPNAGVPDAPVTSGAPVRLRPAEPQPTPEDVELVGTATEQHHIVYGRTDAMGNSPCVCDKWWDSADMPGWDEHMAEVALTALASAGRLVPAGATEEWGWLSVDGIKVYASPSEQDARTAAGRSGWRKLMHRVIGPWQPAPEEEP